MASNPKTNEPSQITGQINAALGLAEQAVGAVIPEALGASDWTESGAALQEAGEKEVDEAKRKKAVEAGVDAGVGKVKSAVGYVTGDQSQQTEGNTQAEKAQWDYKQASSDSPLSVPLPSVEGVKGKLESAQGIVLGDPEKQKEGNVKAEKAAWRDGV